MSGIWTSQEPMQDIFVVFDVTTYVEKHRRDTEKNVSLSVIVYNMENRLFEVQERVSLGY